MEKQQSIGPFLGPLIMLAVVVTIAYVIVYFLKSRRKERSQLIEKGMSPFRDVDIETFNKKSNLKNGILLLSLGLGLVMAQVLLINFDNLDSFITYLTCMSVFGGIGFLITYRLIKRL